MITTGVLLAAGEGTRLRDMAAVKPLCPVAGRPLIDHALHGFAAAGLTRAVVVLGYERGAVEAHLAYCADCQAQAASLGTVTAELAAAPVPTMPTANTAKVICPAMGRSASAACDEVSMVVTPAACSVAAVA